MHASLSSSSFTTSLSATSTQVDRLMDTSQDFDTDPDGVVRWVASQSPIPALQALMKEAEREKRTRPSTPILTEPLSWTHSLTSTASSASLSISGPSPWHPNSSNPIDNYLPLSSDSASTSSSSEITNHRRAKPHALAQRKQLSASTSSMNQPLRPSSRPRSSSHSTTISKSIPKVKDTSPEEETEAATFLELLRDVSRQLDENSKKKQRFAARAQEKGRERSLGRDPNDDRIGSHSSTRAIAKTSSTSAIGSVPLSGSSLERTSSASGSTSISAIKHESRPRILTKTASLGTSHVNLASGSSTPVSLLSPNFACNHKPEPIPRVHNNILTSSNGDHSRIRKADTVEPSSEDDMRDDNAMQGIVIDLTETDTEWDMGRNSGRTTRADTTMSMDVDDEHESMRMDVSFQPKPPPQLHFEPKPKPLSQAQTTNLRPPVPTQRRAGPPPLGMRRAPQLQPSQYSLSQVPKSMNVPRFKPPLLVNAGGNRSGSGNGTKVVNTVTASKQPTRGRSTGQEEEKTQDADSSFDVSFDMDRDALEETMKAYD